MHFVSAMTSLMITKHSEPRRLTLAGQTYTQQAVDSMWYEERGMGHAACSNQSVEGSNAARQVFVLLESNMARIEAGGLG